jgi:superfamily II DNA or RNA helicase
MSFWLIKKVFRSEVAWFTGDQANSHRNGFTVGQSALSGKMDVDQREKVALSIRWFNGSEICQAAMNMWRRNRTWLIEGSPLEASEQEQITDRAIILIHVERGSNDGDTDWTWSVAAVDPNHDTATPVYRHCQDLISGMETVSVPEVEASNLRNLAEQYLPVFHGGEIASSGELSLEQESDIVSWLTRYLKRDDLEQLLDEDETRDTADILALLDLEADEQPTKKALATRVVERFGTQLLAKKKHRKILAKRRFPRQAALSPDAWHPGKAAAHSFTKKLGLPRSLAGTPNRSAPTVEDVVAFPKLGELHPYQQEIADQIRRVLTAREWRERRGIVWLPTGTGKTRVTVETLLNECRLDAPRNCILWIANRQELCEQAMETFRHVWMIRGASTAAGSGEGIPTLRFIRLWGGNHWQEPAAFPTVIVASIQTLAMRTKNHPGEWGELLAILGRRCAAIIFDEAHHTVAPSYTLVRQALGIARNKNLFKENQKTAPPVFGLTATPSRSNDDETERLASNFNGTLLEPKTEFREMNDFIAEGYVSQPDYEVVKTGTELPMRGSKEEEEWKTFQSIPSSALVRLGDNTQRTAFIINDLVGKLDHYQSVLIFACSVKHARTIAQVLDRMGVSAASLDGSTPKSVRWKTVREFRKKNIQVLSSCDLLTTGFDAPEVDAIVLARPVDSRILFAQMVGRGLRGPRNGGTPHCKILDYEDVAGPYRDLEKLRSEFRKGFVGSD